MLIVERKLLNFPLNQIPIDLFIVGIAGLKEDLKDEALQKPARGRVFVFSKIL